MRQDRKLVM